MYQAQTLLVITGLILCGCETQTDHWKEARPATTHASGEVTLDGKPLAGAIVVFQPNSPHGIGASGLTNENGEFELQSFPPDPGAVPGEYTVAIMKTQMPEQPAGGGNTDDPEVVRVVSAIPEKYSLPDRSGLKAEIPDSGTESLLFELTK